MPSRCNPSSWQLFRTESSFHTAHLCATDVVLCMSLGLQRYQKMCTMTHQWLSKSAAGGPHWNTLEPMPDQSCLSAPLQAVCQACGGNVTLVNFDMGVFVLIRCLLFFFHARTMGLQSLANFTCMFAHPSAAGGELAGGLLWGSLLFRCKSAALQMGDSHLGGTGVSGVCAPVSLQAGQAGRKAQSASSHCGWC